MVEHFWLIVDHPIGFGFLSSQRKFKKKKKGLEIASVVEWLGITFFFFGYFRGRLTVADPSNNWQAYPLMVEIHQFFMAFLCRGKVLYLPNNYFHIFID